MADDIWVLQFVPMPSGFLLDAWKIGDDSTSKGNIEIASKHLGCFCVICPRLQLECHHYHEMTDAGSEIDAVMNDVRFCDL